MLNTRPVRTTENSSAIRSIKAGNSEQKVPKLKAKALGDVRNTLHSRLGNVVTPSKNFPSKTSIKPGAQVKAVSHENDFSAKIASEKKFNRAPNKSAIKSVLPSPDFDRETFEIHHHELCEQDQQFYMKDYFQKYKFSEKQIKNLTRSVKCFVTPPSVPFYDPCEDIKVPDMEKHEEKCFSFSDILKDLILPEVPPIQ